jgi:predicted secreted protein
MRRRRSFLWLAWCAALLATVMGSAAAADSVSIIDETLLGLAIDAGAFEPGATLGLEIVGNGADQLLVEHVALLRDDAVVNDMVYDPRVEAQFWLGAVQLVDPSGGVLPSGEYSVAVFTTNGAFLITFSIVNDLRTAPRSDVPEPIAFSGLTLNVYRLVREGEGSVVELRDGDALMVALPGNATTGFAWSDVTENLLPVLESVAGVSYFPDPSPPGAGGVGGTFLFRYRAFAVGTQVLRFEYARPWETVQPVDSTMFSVNVTN